MHRFAPKLRAQVLHISTSQLAASSSATVGCCCAAIPASRCEHCAITFSTQRSHKRTGSYFTKYVRVPQEIKQTDKVRSDAISPVSTTLGRTGVNKCQFLGLQLILKLSNLRSACTCTWSYKNNGRYFNTIEFRPIEKLWTMDSNSEVLCCKTDFSKRAFMPAVFRRRSLV